ncbi:MAG: tetratricopeptide repeat protein [Bacteroidia bacterium]
MKKQLNVLLLFIILCHTAGAVGVSERYEAANKLYRGKNYQEAAQQYETLIKEGAVSPEVYFNLGNAYYKSGIVSKAILNYERAKILDPSDEDIQFNLRLAYSGTVDKIEPIPLLFYQRWWLSFLHITSPSGWSWASILCIWLTLVIAIYYLFAPTPNAKRNSFLAAFTFLLISLTGFFISYAAEHALNAKNSAVVMESTAYIKSSPDDKSTNLFLLHEGTKVEVLKEADGWKQIRIANGNVGWVQESQLEMI